MKIAILGTGIVGRTLADRLHEVGHDIVMGTQDPNATLARTGTDARQVPLRDWLSEHPKIRLAGMSDAAAHGEVIVNALPGVATLDALSHIDPGATEGKVLLDTALPLKRHEGLPPTLTGVEELSLAEQIQHAHPGVRVVKSLNTMAAPLMVDPGRVPGDHVVFVTGNDIEAKKTVRALLRQFGWEDDVIHDIGDVRTSRGPEMYAYLLFQLAASFGSFDFNIAINRAASTGGTSLLLTKENNYESHPDHRVS